MPIISHQVGDLGGELVKNQYLPASSFIQNLDFRTIPKGCWAFHNKRRHIFNPYILFDGIAFQPAYLADINRALYFAIFDIAGIKP